MSIGGGSGATRVFPTATGMSPLLVGASRLRKLPESVGKGCAGGLGISTHGGVEDGAEIEQREFLRDAQWLALAGEF